MDTPIKVFLSHASANFEKMKEMADYLESLGLICWYAPRNIDKGNNYLVDIVDAIDQVDVVILLHSKEVHHSKFVYREIEYADQMNKLILPILIDDAPIAKELILIVRSMQMTFLHEFPSIPQAIDVLYERMLTYKLEAEQGDVSKDWLQSIGKPILQKSSTGHTATAFLIKDSRLETLRRVYVPVSHFQEVEEQLHKEHLTVLQHTERVGKFSTGINLLLQQEVEQMIEFLPTLSMLDLLNMPFKPKTGYIMDHANLDFFEKSTLTMWEELQDTIQRAGSYVVITTDDSDLPEWLVSKKIERPKDTKLMLVNHAKESGLYTLSESLLEELEPYIEKLLPHEIASIPEKLEKVIDGTLHVEEMIDQLQSQIDVRVKNWFEKNGQSLPLVAQYVTLAILQDVPEKTLMDASKLMEECLKPSWPQGQENVSFLTDEARLSLLNAERISKKVNSDMGYIKIDCIRMKNDEEAEHILIQFWEQFRFERVQFLSWFHTYLAQAKKTVMSTIEHALTSLASHDLPAVRQELLQDWAKHDQTIYRLTTVKILSELIKKDLYVQQIMNLVTSWSSQRNNHALQWTASAAIGSEIGVLLYPKSLKLLQKSFLSNPSALRNMTRQSYTKLFHAGIEQRDYTESFLQHFHSWQQESDQRKYLHFIYSVLRSARFELLSALSADQVQQYLAPFIVEALLDSKSKRLAEEWLTSTVNRYPEKLVPLMLTLLYHDQYAVSERAKLWLKNGMTSTNKQRYAELYENMMEYKGRMTK
ncbi:hypothetical protein CJ195_26895 [Bacillus sp. UMB0899]|nr:hypothetical protein CJ195_26895 [Bacillus sp. UMB0899]